MAATAPATAGPITFGGDASAMITYDFEQYADMAGSPGSALAYLGDPDFGVVFGERLVGQVNNPVDDFDVITGVPNVPLAIDMTVDPVVAINILTFRGTIIDGLGPVGYPHPEGIGDGAVTVLFARDQSLIAFDVLGANAGPMEVQFFDRAGRLLDTLTVAEVKSQSYVFGSENGDIAAITLTTRDFSGLGYDNFRFVPGPPQRDSRCDMEDAHALDPASGSTSVALDAGVADDPDGGFYSYRWATDCPSGRFDDYRSATPVFSVGSVSGCRVECSVSVLVDDGVETDVCTATIMIEGDEPADEVECPSDMTVESDGDGNLNELEAWLASATTDGGSVTDDFNQVDYGCNATGSVMVTWETSSSTFGGGCGGSAECTATFTIVDTTAPTLSLGTASLEVDNPDCSGTVTVELPHVEAADDSGGGVVVTHDAPALFPSGATTSVTYTATDPCGNTTAATLAVTVGHGGGVRIVVQRQDDGSAAAGVSLLAFDVGRDSCARSFADSDRGVSANAYENILANCDPAGAGETGPDGTGLVGLATGQFVVIGQSDSDGDGSLDVVGGAVTGQVRCGAWTKKHLRMGEDRRGE